MSLYKDIERAIGPGEFNYAYNISLRHNYMYVENAKAACTTLKTIFGSLEFSDAKLGTRLPRKYLNNVHANVLGTPFVKPFQLGPERFDNLLRGQQLLRMTFVRNPYARLLSAYLDKIVRRLPESIAVYNEAEKLKLRTNADALSLRDFLLCVRSQLRENIRVDKHWRPQFVQTHIEKIEYQVIGQVESLKADLMKVESVLECALDYPGRVGGHETGADLKLVDYYDRESQDLVEEIYHEDFTCFGYKFGLSR